MSQKPLDMSLQDQIKTLRENGKGFKTIADLLGLSKNTVKKYAKESEKPPNLATQINMKAGIVSVQTEDIRKSILFNHFDEIMSTSELKKTGVTKQLLWSEYKVLNKDGYQYSQYCNLFRLYSEQKDVAIHWDYNPGEFIQADFAGDKMYVIKPDGEKISCEIFVSIFPFSGLIFCYAVWSQKTEDFAICIREMFRYYGHVPLTILVDNLRTAVKKSNLYEPSFTDLCNLLAVHYGTTFSATRPGRPSDKGMVENAVHIVYKHIYAPLRNERFTSIENLNLHLRKQLEILNHKKYRGEEESRLDLFLRAELPSLKDLPESHYEHIQVKMVKVQRNYHFQLDQKHYYSVPFRYAGQRIKVYFNQRKVEVYYENERIALHMRRSNDPRYNTIKEHMPDNHIAVKEQRGWTEEGLVGRAEKIGAYTAQIARRIIHSSIYPQQNFKACDAMIRLSQIYGNERLEAACIHAAINERPTYTLICTILDKGMDKTKSLFDSDEPVTLPKNHENVRGSDYYQ